MNFRYLPYVQVLNLKKYIYEQKYNTIFFSNSFQIAGSTYHNI